MSALGRLIRMEMQFQLLRGTKKRPGVAFVLNMVFLIGCGTYLFHDHTEPSAVFVISPALIWGIIMILSAANISSWQGSPYKEWWLMLPYSRRTLAKAKLLGLMLIGAAIACIMPLICFAIYSIEVYYGSMREMPLQELLNLSAANLLCSLAIIPFASSVGVSISWMYHGAARWLLIPYTLIQLLPFAAIGLVGSVGQMGTEWFTVSRVWLYAGIITFAGFPISYLLYRLLAIKGMKSLGVVAGGVFQGTMEARRSPDKKARILQPRIGASPLMALYQLDRSRFRVLGAKPVVRIMKVIFITLLTVMGFYADRLDIISVGPSTFFTVLSLAAILWMMSRPLLERKTILWWLVFPFKRSQVLLSAVAALSATMFKWMLLSTLGIIAGQITAISVGRMATDVLISTLPWLIFSLLVRWVWLTVMLAMLQLNYLFTNNTFLSILIIPLYLVSVTYQYLIDKWYIPAEAALQTTPQWSLLGWTVLIGIPLFILCIRVGGKYAHVILQSVDRTQGSLKSESH